MSISSSGVLIERLRVISAYDEKSEDAYSEAETIARREAALKRMLSMPHKPHQPKNKNNDCSAPLE
jgi:hypothetical protein